MAYKVSCCATWVWFSFKNAMASFFINFYRRHIYRQGGVFELSPNDDLVAAPGASRALQNMSQGGGNVSQATTMIAQSNNGTDELIKTIKELKSAYTKGAQVNLDGQKVIRGLGRVGNETTQNNFSLV